MRFVSCAVLALTFSAQADGSEIKYRVSSAYLNPISVSTTPHVRVQIQSKPIIASDLWDMVPDRFKAGRMISQNIQTAIDIQNKLFIKSTARNTQHVEGLFN